MIESAEAKNIAAWRRAFSTAIAEAVADGEDLGTLVVAVISAATAALAEAKGVAAAHAVLLGHLAAIEDGVAKARRAMAN